MGETAGMTVSVLVVDDQPSLVQLLRLLLEQDERFGPVYDAMTAPDALDSAAAHPPDVIVLDAGLGPADGLSLVRPLHSRAPEASVVVFSSSPYADRRSSLLAGAQAFVEKGTDLDVLLDTIAVAGQPDGISASG
jgi:two-component system KDP operon response regulator KdpE